MGKEFVFKRVRAFLGQQLGGGAQVTITDERMDLVGERCHVADGDRPLVRVAAHGLTGQTELQGTVGQGPQPQIPLGIPLHASGRPLQLPLPSGPVGMHPADVTRQARVSQRPLEAGTADLDSEDGLLPRLRTPTTA